MATRLGLGLVLLLALPIASAQSQSGSRYTVDPAPSGSERSERFVNPDTGASVTHPGRDAPVTETRDGNTIRLDFDTRGQPGRENDTTIIVGPNRN